jgi:hypothetical protein
MLARASIIAVTAIPQQGWTTPRLRIKQRGDRIDHHSIDLIDPVRLQGHAPAVMTLLKLGEQSVGTVLHHPRRVNQ